MAGVVKALAPFEATLHLVSGLVCEAGEGRDEATGTAACVAHHVRDGADLVLYGRYRDAYRRGEDGAWRFAARELRVIWTEKRPVRVC